MKQQGLSLRTKTYTAQKMPADYECTILKFHRFIIDTQKKTSFELDQIGNMDKVPLTFDVPSNRTVTVKGYETVTVKTTGHEKIHYTAVLACCVDGTKLPLLLIFNRKLSPKIKQQFGLVHIYQGNLSHSINFPQRIFLRTFF